MRGYLYKKKCNFFWNGQVAAPSRFYCSTICISPESILVVLPTLAGMLTSNSERLLWRDLPRALGTADIIDPPEVETLVKLEGSSSAELSDPAAKVSSTSPVKE